MKFPANTLANLYALLGAITASVAPIVISLGGLAGALLGFLGITVAGMAIVRGSFFWFCIGLVMAGGANSFAQQYRFAASDYVQDTIKLQAISRLLIRGYRGWRHRPTDCHAQQRFFVSNPLCWRIFEWCWTFCYRFFGDDASTVSNS